MSIKVKTSPYERAINRLAQGTPKDCDLADELEQAVRASMRAALTLSGETEARISAAVAEEREQIAKMLEGIQDTRFDTTPLASLIRARGQKGETQ